MPDLKKLMMTIGSSLSSTSKKAIPTVGRYMPILKWGKEYNRETLNSDLLAAVIVTIMLVPQSLAYALLAGLPPQAGLYASILPIVLYAIFGTSRALAVGPVAVISLMTATAIGQVVAETGIGYGAAALSLAFLSGLFLVILGLFKLGFMANFLSHPVISGFITASGILIAVSQLKHIFGISASGHTLPGILGELWYNLGSMSFITLLIGIVATGFLFWARKGLKPLLLEKNYSPKIADVITKAAPIAAVIGTTLIVGLFGLDQWGVKVVGEIPQGLPPLTMPSLGLELLSHLLLPAILISIIGFVESVSVAQTLAAKERQRIDPNQELIGLGAANIGASITGGYPVTGGFSRSVVNYDAGAKSPAAGAYTAVGLLGASLFLTPLIFFLPKATLAATIIVAVLSLVDFSILKRAWGYSRADFFAVATTILATLFLGVEIGVSAGVILSIATHLYKTSKPHMAVVGRVPNTEHFRNVLRHEVETDPAILSLRVDESLYFANARYLEDKLYDMIAQKPELKHVVLQCPAINEIDLSALESLEAINERLNTSNVKLHLSEVKGPVMDRLKREHFLDEMTGKVFLSHHEAMMELGNSETGN